MYITRVLLNQIRGFRNFDLPFYNEDGAPRMRTAIIGKNGTCKTTLLRSIALGLCDRPQANALLHEPTGRLISEGARNATITIELSSKTSPKRKVRINTRLKRNRGRDIVWRQNELKLSKSILVCGYGAGRSTEGPESGRQYQIIDSVYTLFNYDQTLVDTELTLRRLRDFLGNRLYNNTLAGIKSAMGLSERDKIETRRGGGVEISGPSIGRNIPLEGWADGYRRTFNWILDLYAWAMRADTVTDGGGIVGIVLIDEIEQHIHPSMQMELLSNLSRLLPELQIIATTHSPIIALGAEPEELVALKRTGKTVKKTDLPDFTGYSAGDMLIDERLFETAAYKPEQVSEMERYRTLVQIPKTKRSRKESNDLVSITRKLRNQERPPSKESAVLKELKKLGKKYDL